MSSKEMATPETIKSRVKNAEDRIVQLFGSSREKDFVFALADLSCVTGTGSLVVDKKTFVSAMEGRAFGGNHGYTQHVVDNSMKGAFRDACDRVGYLAWVANRGIPVKGVPIIEAINRTDEAFKGFCQSVVKSLDGKVAIVFIDSNR